MWIMITERNAWSKEMEVRKLLVVGERQRGREKLRERGTDRQRQREERGEKRDRVGVRAGRRRENLRNWLRDWWGLVIPKSLGQVSNLETQDFYDIVF